MRHYSKSFRAFVGIVAICLNLMLLSSFPQTLPSQQDLGASYRMGLLKQEDWSISTTNSAADFALKNLRDFSNETTQQQTNKVVVLSNATTTLARSSSKATTTSTHNPIMDGPLAPWTKSKLIPQWMKDYFQWHAKARQTITDDNWQQYDYLVVRCLSQDEKCGGGADRLQSLPFMLLLANRTQRLLFYKWERPAALEHFLVPPQGGMNWTWPPTEALSNHSFGGRPDLFSGNQIHSFMGYQDPNEKSGNKMRRKYPQIASIKYQSHNHGRIEYDTLRPNNQTDAHFIQVFRDCWNSVFEPSPAVQKRIEAKRNELHLLPGHFHAIHIRSRYIDPFGESKLQGLAANSMNCLRHITHNTTMSLQRDTPVLVSSDGTAAVQAALRYAQQKGLTHVLSQTTVDNNNDNSSQPENLHLDRGTEFLSRNAKEYTQHEPHEYFDTFVDLYLLSDAQCIVFGYGNYGRWSNLLSRDVSCHRDTQWGTQKRCDWEIPGLSSNLSIS